MPVFEYTGPCPVPGDDGVLMHPGDVFEFDSEPPGGGWRLLLADSPPSAALEAKTPAPAPPAPAAAPAPASAAASPSASEGKQA
jgi:hypothetical protein